MTSPIDKALSFQQTALNLRAYRQEVLASNIANADTPNYKARDVDFQSALQNALAGPGSLGGALPLTTTAAGHLAGSGAPMGVQTLYRNEHQASLDGNTVDADVERSQFAQNALNYDANLTFINNFLKTMQNAMSS